jgi:hypothetical protein
MRKCTTLCGQPPDRTRSRKTDYAGAGYFEQAARLHANRCRNTQIVRIKIVIMPGIHGLKSDVEG